MVVWHAFDMPGTFSPQPLIPKNKSNIVDNGDETQFLVWIIQNSEQLRVFLAAHTTGTFGTSDYFF